MDTKSYNIATAYFRNLEKENPNVPQWGKFADAMDEVISTCVPVIRCKDCKHCFVDGDNVTYNVCKLNHNKVQPDEWWCADGERK